MYINTSTLMKLGHSLRGGWWTSKILILNSNSGILKCVWGQIGDPKWGENLCMDYCYNC